jgi:hypothetical protein
LETVETKYLEKKNRRNKTALPTFGGFLPSVAGVRCRGGSSDSDHIVPQQAFRKQNQNTHLLSASDDVDEK